MYAILILMTISLMAGYWLALHHSKDRINEWVDINAPLWVTTCRFCRGFWFGVPFGVALAALVALILKYFAA